MVVWLFVWWCGCYSDVSFNLGPTLMEPIESLTDESFDFRISHHECLSEAFQEPVVSFKIF